MTTTDIFPISIILLFQACYTNEIIPYVTFWNWPFSLSLYPWGSSKLLSVSIFHSFYWWEASHCMNAPVYLPIHPSKDFFPRFWPLQIKLWTFMYTFLYNRKFLFLLDKWPNVQLLGHVVSTWLVLQEIETAIYFFSVAVPFYILISDVSVVQVFCILARIWCFQTL